MEFQPRTLLKSDGIKAVSRLRMRLCRNNPHKDFVTAKKLSGLTVQIARQDESIARLHQHRARKPIAQFFP